MLGQVVYDGQQQYVHELTYDAVGNRTLQQKDGALTTFAYDAANQLTTSKDSTGTTTYSFDKAGNLTLAQAHPNSRTTYIWDDENRNKILQVASTAIMPTCVVESAYHCSLRADSSA